MTPLRRLNRLLPRGSRRFSDCTPRRDPPPLACPPCKPKRPPPCRAHHPEKKTVLHVTCCPPPQGQPPPCKVARPTCSLNCSNARRSTGLQATGSSVKCKVGCSQDRDRVAIRLAAAREFRRQEYLRDAAERKPPPPPNDPPFRLSGSNVCAGVVADKRAPCPHGTCGPDRRPSPPRCVELKPESECTIRHTDPVDPCAHHPRVVINIDRSGRSPYPAAPAAPAASPAPSAAPNASCAGGLTSRIMKSLNLNRSGSSCGKSTEAQPSLEKTAGTAKFAGDSSWCQSLPRPRSAPCVPRDNATPLTGPPTTRQLHTTAITYSKSAPPSNAKEDANKLKSMLSARESLKEVARGRIVRDEPTSGAARTGGMLEVGVPQGVSSVRVQVMLDADTAGTEPSSKCSRSKCPTAAATNPASVVSCSSGAGGKTDPWLSLKNIQKKIVDSCRKSDNSSVMKCGKVSGGDSCGSAPKIPSCASPKKPCSPSPPPPPAPAPSKPCEPTPPKPCKQVPANPCAPKSKSFQKNPCANKCRPIFFSKPFIMLFSV